MTAAEIAAALGNAQRSAAWHRCRCPVHNGRSASLALRDGNRRLIVHCHAGCAPEAVLDELRRRGLLVDFSPHPGVDNSDKGDKTLPPAETRDRQFRTACALDRWRHETRPARGTIVERYWRVRGLAIAVPDTIRASAGWMRHRESGETRPAMVGLVQHVERGPSAIHVTWLAPDGSGKATLEPPRKFFGQAAGAAIRLAPANDVDWLIFGEGIETTASVMQATGLPGWAAGWDGGIERLVLPAQVRRVLIAADHDKNGAGERAARRAAQRWLAEGRRVRIAMPPNPGTDFNDFVKGGGGAAR
jgi:putative DNA primase/helicase